MRPMLGVCGAIVVTVCLAPVVRASDHLPLLMGPLVHSNITAANSAQEAVGQSETSSTTADKPEKQRVTTQRVVEHTTTVKPEKQHVTKQRVVEDTTTVQVQPQEPH